jgi:ABC-type branched-subunit amino acid transport system ATPase component
MLETRNLVKSFGPIRVTRDVSLRLEPGERRVILGPNGAGKTTLFNLLVGELRPDSGSIRVDGADLTALRVAERARGGLSRSYQKNTLFDGLTVRENLGLAAAVALGRGQDLWSDPLRSAEVRETVCEVAAQVDLAPHLEARVDAVSYGIRRQLEVGIALATRPRCC